MEEDENNDHDNYSDNTDSSITSQDCEIIQSAVVSNKKRKDPSLAVLGSEQNHLGDKYSTDITGNNYSDGNYVHGTESSVLLRPSAFRWDYANDLHHKNRRSSSHGKFHISEFNDHLDDISAGMVEGAMSSQFVGIGGLRRNDLRMYFLC